MSPESFPSPTLPDNHAAQPPALEPATRFSRWVEPVDGDTGIGYHGAGNMVIAGETVENSPISTENASAMEGAVSPTHETTVPAQEEPAAAAPLYFTRTAAYQPPATQPNGAPASPGRHARPESPATAPGQPTAPHSFMDAYHDAQQAQSSAPTPNVAPAAPVQPPAPEPETYQPRSRAGRAWDTVAHPFASAAIKTEELLTRPAGAPKPERTARQRFTRRAIGATAIALVSGYVAHRSGLGMDSFDHLSMPDIELNNLLPGDSAQASTGAEQASATMASPDQNVTSGAPDLHPMVESLKQDVHEVLDAVGASDEIKQSLDAVAPKVEMVVEQKLAMANHLAETNMLAQAALVGTGVVVGRVAASKIDKAVRHDIAWHQQYSKDRKKKKASKQQQKAAIKKTA